MYLVCVVPTVFCKEDRNLVCARDQRKQCDDYLDLDSEYMVCCQLFRKLFCSDAIRSAFRPQF